MTTVQEEVTSQRVGPVAGGSPLSEEMPVAVIRPVRIGDILTAEVEVIAWNRTKRIIRLTARCFGQAGDDVVTGEVVLLVEPPQV